MRLGIRVTVLVCAVSVAVVGMGGCSKASAARAEEPKASTTAAHDGGPTLAETAKWIQAEAPHIAWAAREHSTSHSYESVIYSSTDFKLQECMLSFRHKSEWAFAGRYVGKKKTKTDFLTSVPIKDVDLGALKVSVGPIQMINPENSRRPMS